MIKQCVFSWSVEDEIGSLRIWPLRVSDEVAPFLTGCAFGMAVVLTNRGVAVSDGIFPLGRQVPGRFVDRQSFGKILTKTQILNYLRESRDHFPIDFFCLFFKTKNEYRAKKSEVAEALKNYSRPGLSHLLQQIDGFFIYAHDGDSVTFRTAKKSLAFDFYRQVVTDIVPGVSRKSLSDAWRLLQATSGCQVVTGYNQTIYLRMEEPGLLEQAQFCSLLHWDFDSEKVCKAGEFNPRFGKKIYDASDLQFHLKE